MPITESTSSWPYRSTRIRTFISFRTGPRSKICKSRDGIYYFQVSIFNIGRYLLSKERIFILPDSSSLPLRLYFIYHSTTFVSYSFKMKIISILCRENRFSREKFRNVGGKNNRDGVSEVTSRRSRRYPV